MGKQKRENFNSKLGAVLALAGSAVGLGNIWRFPYLAAENGGGAFILVYVVCILLVSLPIMLSEFVVGRRSRSNAFSAIRTIEPKGAWRHFGILAILIPFATLCYYCVIGGWTLDYLFKSLAGQFGAGVEPEAIEGMFGAFVGSTFGPLVFTFLFLAATAVIIMMGVGKGIENSSKVMMPLLFFIMLLIAVRSMTLPGAAGGISYLLKPDFSKITPDVCLKAMGQSFYSLSIGMGIMITYSSYLPKSNSLTRTAVYTVSSDFIFAIIAALAIIPAMFAYQMPTAQGTGLVFKALPVVFSRMAFGNLIASVFFFAVLLAALTSSMSLFEVPVGWLVEKKQMSRKKACLLVLVSAMAIATLCSLSFGPLKDVVIYGKTIFDIFDYVIGNYLMPMAGLIIVLFVGWKMKRNEKLDELYGGRTDLSRIERMWFNIQRFLVKYVSPAAIIAIFISGIL